MGAAVRLVQEGRWAVMLGLVEMLRPGETTRGMPEVEFEVMRAARERMAGVMNLNLCILRG